MPYLRAARFVGERPAGHAYEQAQRAIYARPDSDLSVYRLQLNQVWHVAALGEPPPADLADMLKRILATGELVPRMGGCPVSRYGTLLCRDTKRFDAAAPMVDRTASPKPLYRDIS